MKNDREICKNFTNDYLIYVLSQMPKTRPGRGPAHQKALSGSLQLIRAVVGQDILQSSAPGHESTYAGAK